MTIKTKTMQSISEVNNSKILIFDSISNKENTIISNNRQSITLIVSCGCQQTEHFLCGNINAKNKENNTDLMTNRSIYTTLCKLHKNYKL